MYEYLLFEVDENSIGTLTINKERAMNTLSLETMKELKQFTENELINTNLKFFIFQGVPCFHLAFISKIVLFIF